MGETAQPGPGVAGASATEFLDTTISRPDAGTVLLSVRGEIDTLTAPAFTAATDDLLAESGDALVVDLSEVRFLASSGLAVLISAAHRAEERGLRLQLVAPTRAVRRPLEITGTGQLFDLHTDVSTVTGGRD
jgi:anti-sigma B factor antagonist